LVFAAKAGGFHCAGHDHHQLVDVEGLFDEVVSTLLNGGDGDFNVSVS
jgi:hypothetical protein